MRCRARDRQQRWLRVESTTLASADFLVPLYRAQDASAFQAARGLSHAETRLRRASRQANFGGESDAVDWWGRVVLSGGDAGPDAAPRSLAPWVADYRRAARQFRELAPSRPLP